MIVLFFVSLVSAVLWTVFVIFANSMSDAPMSGFRGEGSIIVVWVLVVVFFLAWMFS